LFWWSSVFFAGSVELLQIYQSCDDTERADLLILSSSARSNYSWIAKAKEE